MQKNASLRQKMIDWLQPLQVSVWPKSLKVQREKSENGEIEV